MKNLRKIVRLLPEIYLIISVLYYWSLTANTFNPYAIILLMVLIFQAITQKKFTGIIISSIFVMINCYLVLALVSELFEFSEFNSKAQKLAIGGAFYLGLNILIGSIMLYNNIIKNTTKNSKLIDEVH